MTRDPSHAAEALLHKALADKAGSEIARLYTLANDAISLLRRSDDWSREHADHASFCPFDVAHKPVNLACTCGLKDLSQDVSDFLDGPS